MKENTTNINFGIPNDLHQKVKAKSALLGLSMQEFILRLMEAGTRNISEEDLQPRETRKEECEVCHEKKEENDLDVENGKTICQECENGN